jgi:tetratricopeptide (TPR) repeat protein
MKSGWTVSNIHRGGLLPIVSALAFSLVHSGPSLAQTAQVYREQASTLARSKSWDEAIAAYRRAVELDPNDALTHYDLAFALKYKGDTKQAVEEFETAIRLKPGWGEAHYGLGAALYDLHDQAEALKEFRKAVELQPSNAAAHLFLAHVYSEQNDFSAAERALNRAVALKPSAEMHLELGQIEGQLGKLDAAATQFRAALRLDPRMARAHVMLGVTLRRQGDHHGALANFRKAVELDPADPNAQYNLAMELKAEGDIAAAITAFRRAIELKPDFEKAHYGLGIALRAQGDATAAHKELDELNGLHSFRTHLAQAKLLTLQGVDALKKQQLDEALNFFQQAIDESPELPTGYYYLGVAWDRKRDYARAQEA